MLWRISAAPWLELGVGLLGALAVSAAFRCAREDAAVAAPPMASAVPTGPAKRAKRAKPRKPAEPSEPEVYEPTSPREPFERRFYPSKEEGIELPNFESREWARKRRSVVLEFQRDIIPETHPALLYGAHIDDDGTVWEYKYATSPSFQQSGCQAALCAHDPAARDACLNASSRLVARLSRERLAELLGAIAKVGRGGRIGYAGGRYDASLTVRAPGGRDSEPLVLAACRWGDGFQLDSREAKVIIDLFRRVRNGARLWRSCLY